MVAGSLPPARKPTVAKKRKEPRVNQAPKRGVGILGGKKK